MPSQMTKFIISAITTHYSTTVVQFFVAVRLDFSCTSLIWEAGMMTTMLGVVIFVITAVFYSNLVCRYQTSHG